MLEIARGNHHAVDVLAAPASLRSTYRICGSRLNARFTWAARCSRARLQMSQTATVSTGICFGGERGHMHMALAAIAATELTQPNAIVGAEDPRIGLALIPAASIVPVACFINVLRSVPLPELSVMMHLFPSIVDGGKHADLSSQRLPPVRFRSAYSFVQHP